MAPVAAELTDRQKTCMNVWHRQPGHILACPICGLTKTDNDSRPQPRAAAPAPQPQQAMRARVQIKSFEHANMATVTQEANDWLTKVSNDSRIHVAEKLSMFSHAGLIVIAVYYATEF